jgi:hypothetical protein
MRNDLMLAISQTLFTTAKKGLLCLQTSTEAVDGYRDWYALVTANGLLPQCHDIEANAHLPG